MDAGKLGRGALGTCVCRACLGQEFELLRVQEFGEHQGFDFHVFVAVAKVGRRPDSADFPGFCTSKVLPLADVASKQFHFGAFSRSSAVEACRCWDPLQLRSTCCIQFVDCERMLTPMPMHTNWMPPYLAEALMDEWPSTYIHAKKVSVDAG